MMPMGSPNIGPAKRGKCNECRLIYQWTGAPMIRDAYCNHCRKGLRKVFMNLKGGYTVIKMLPYVPSESVIGPNPRISPKARVRKYIPQPRKKYRISGIMKMTEADLDNLEKQVKEGTQ